MTHLISDYIDDSLRKEIDELFAIAVHVYATPFSFFEQSSWYRFFNKLRSNWKIPSPSVFGGELLDKIYNMVMEKTINEIKNSGVGTLSIDGATDKLAKSKFKVK